MFGKAPVSSRRMPFVVTIDGRNVERQSVGIAKEKCVGTFTRFVVDTVVSNAGSDWKDLFLIVNGRRSRVQIRLPSDTGPTLNEPVTIKPDDMVRVEALHLTGKSEKALSVTLIGDAVTDG
jgi:hypothetical protein